MCLRVRYQRGMSLVEMMVAMVILTLLAFAVGFMFDQTVKHWALSSSTLSSEQQARIAVAKVTDAMRQASLISVATPDANGQTPIPIAIPSVASSPSNQVVFYQVDSLNPSDLPTDVNGEPVPCYNKVTIAWVPPSPAPSPPQYGSQITEDVTPYAGSCHGVSQSSASIIANNVTNFSVTENPGSGSNGQTADYQVDVQVTSQVRVDQTPSVYQLTETVHPVMAGGN